MLPQVEFLEAASAKTKGEYQQLDNEKQEGILNSIKWRRRFKCSGRACFFFCSEVCVLVSVGSYTASVCCRVYDRLSTTDGLVCLSQSCTDPRLCLGRNQASFWRGVYDGVLCLLTRSLRWCALSADEEFTMVCFVCWLGVYDGVLCLLTRSLRWCALSADEEFTMAWFVCWRGVYDGVLCLLTGSLRQAHHDWRCGLAVSVVHWFKTSPGRNQASFFLFLWCRRPVPTQNLYKLTVRGCITVAYACAAVTCHLHFWHDDQRYCGNSVAWYRSSDVMNHQHAYFYYDLVITPGCP